MKESTKNLRLDDDGYKAMLLTQDDDGLGKLFREQAHAIMLLRKRQKRGKALTPSQQRDFEALVRKQKMVDREQRMRTKPTHKHQSIIQTKLAQERKKMNKEAPPPANKKQELAPVDLDMEIPMPDWYDQNKKYFWVNGIPQRDPTRAEYLRNDGDCIVHNLGQLHVKR